MIEAVVAIPVRNEVERIADCLAALDDQNGLAPGTLGIVLLVNNTTDGSDAAAEAARPGIAHDIRLLVRDSPEANAGWARRGAMDAAATWLDEAGMGHGAILTTDADSRVAPDWVARNLAAIANGADAVAGTISLDPADITRLSPALQARGLLEATYHALLDELSAAIDPDPDDPWPNHSVTMGGSFAVTLAAYRQVGGMPPVALGEDRAFVARLQEAGLKLRHDPSVQVVASGRLVGRAAGGVADTMMARQDDPECLCDARLEPLDRALVRFRWNRRLRRLHAGGRLTEFGLWTRLLEVSPVDARMIARKTRIGTVLVAVGRCSPKFSDRPLRPSELPLHIAAAKVALVELRQRALNDVESCVEAMLIGRADPDTIETCT